MSKVIEGVIIDPQMDFCDPSGTLYVPGAHMDTARLADMVNRLGNRVDDYHVTLDSHRLAHIAHPIFWKDSSGDHPSPFTIISASDVAKGVWTTTHPGYFYRALDYVKQLETNGRYPLCIWPPHCLIGSQGHSVVPILFNALSCWEFENFASVDYVPKGSNLLTEHYSAIAADVPDPSDPTTQINKPLVETLMKADIVFIAGQASSHCVANTVRDIANQFGDDSYVKKLVFLKDASSPVPGFEATEVAFLQEMTSRGMQISNTADFLK